MRLFTATLATETNTFSPLPTSLENYRESVFFRPGEHPADAPRMCTAPLFVARSRARAEGFELIEGSCFAASPAGTTNRADYETMRDEILGQLEAALPVDGLLLGLHGAMVAHGYDDVEGDIIERCRALVGPKCVIGVELDPHCHLTMKRVSNADIIIDQFDEMLELSQERPLVMGVALHAYLVGQPHRLRHLKRALRHIAKHRDRIWLTTPGAIARHCVSLPTGIVP